jgi:hypothetical protein
MLENAMMCSRTPLLARNRDQLADHAHGRQHHDVDRGVRVEPEHVLEQHRVAAQRGSKMPMWKTRSQISSTSVMAITGVPST